MYLLHTYPDRFVIDVDSHAGYAFGGPDGSLGSGAGESLLIERASGAISRSKLGATRGAQGAAFSERIDGIVGIIT
jgi:hypothetical protein